MNGLIKKPIRLILFLVFPFILNAQSENVVDDYFKNIKTKYAVPDAPAFTILSGSTGSILKPSSVKELALSLTDFLSGEKISLPKSFAIEFSPGLLLKGKNFNADDYESDSWLYRLRLSAATKRSDNSNAATSLAFGLRYTNSDESDPREIFSDADRVEELTELAGKINEAYTAARIRMGIMEPLEKLSADPEVQKVIEEVHEQINNELSSELWNKNITEFAFAFRTESDDSLAENLELREFALWYSAAFGIGNWGQFVAGAKADYKKQRGSGSFNGGGSAAAKFYLGSNNYKFFCEAQSEFIEGAKPTWVLNAGFEMRVDENLWSDFSAGIKNTASGTSALITDFKLKYGI